MKDGRTRRLVYGPVGSRRFGVSLGVDPVPPKTCCYDCIYCQQGRTTRMSVERERFYPVEEVIAQVRDAVERGPRPDVVTLAGSGEPTLYRPLGRLIEELRAQTGAPVVLLTNGALASDPEVCEQAARADVVGPSLDAGDEETFQRINRPHPSIRFDRMVAGLRELSRRSRGRTDLEVFLARGVNDSDEQVRAIAEMARSIAPDSVQLNTAVRPVPGDLDLAVEPERLDVLAEAFGPTCRVIASFDRVARRRAGVDPARVLEVLERRPCTAEEIAASLGVSLPHVRMALSKLERLGRVERTQRHWRATRP
jgi:wyosine [tRNA(Phe)-imidazoG37] synthetase (radical SAM superfamily)